MLGLYYACTLNLDLTSSSVYMSTVILYTAGCWSSGPNMIAKNNSHCSNMDTADFHPSIGTMFWNWRRETLYV